MVIGIEGKPGSGKSSVSTYLTNSNEGFIHLEESGLLLKFVGLAMECKDKNMDDDGIIAKLNNLVVTYKIENKEVIFDINEKITIDKSDLDKKLFAYENARIKESVVKKIYGDLYKIIDILKRDYVVVLSGRELAKVYPDIDKIFCLIVQDDIRKSRMVKRDKEIEKVYLREKEDNNYFENSNNSIIINATNKSIEDISKEICQYIEI